MKRLNHFATFIALTFVTLLFGFAFAPTAPAAPLDGACAGPTSGRVSCWKAQNNSNDSVGSNNGTLQGDTSYAAGRVGKSFDLDGFNDYVQFADDASLKPQLLTLAAWVSASGVGELNDASEWSEVVKVKHKD